MGVLHEGLMGVLRKGADGGSYKRGCWGAGFGGGGVLNLLFNTKIGSYFWSSEIRY